MNDDNQQRVIIDQPGMSHVVTKEYLQIWGSDVMISRWFFKRWTIFMFLFTFIIVHIMFGVALGGEVILNLYAVLLAAFIHFHVVNWFLLPIEGIGLTSIIVIWWFDHKKKVTTKERERLQLLRRESNTDTIDVRG